MEEQERLKRKIKNATELHSLVRIMKALSASNIREYGQAVESLALYSKTIEMGLQIAVQSEPKELLVPRSVERRKRLGAVIFGSDQGLCGDFNERIAAFALEKMREIEHEERVALAVGERVISRLEESGQRIEMHLSFFGDHQGITRVMLEVLVEIEGWRRERGVDQIVLFYNRPGQGAAFSPHMAQLFPLDLKWLRSLAERKWTSRTLPDFTMDVDQLFFSLVRHYLFVSLYRAFVESLASENASRLLSMQMAERNIEEHLSELGVQFNRERQAEITSELLDVVTGFEALSGE